MTLIYLPICREAPTLRGLEDSLQASINFLRMNKHSRNVEKNGWWESKQRDVSEWLRIRWNQIVYGNGCDFVLYFQFYQLPAAFCLPWGRVNDFRHFQNRYWVPLFPAVEEADRNCYAPGRRNPADWGNRARNRLVLYYCFCNH